ncbi:hypothetical protein RHGRI_023601 [Rhododendron griersonianum]|uniref:Major facilitator superfamily (MFS) profile domain-containing protein n=1 Tax=Rhododendron griersonianum TaxID=479676 RepID=A0AAV6J9I9_9ERIC|nr:hypothetical protein RHGRI_023601 [Rhododendron griersonianum]
MATQDNDDDDDDIDINPFTMLLLTDQPQPNPHDDDDDDDVPNPNLNNSPIEKHHSPNQQHQLHYLPSLHSTVVIRQLPSQGLSFQLWPAATSLFSLLDLHRSHPSTSPLSPSLSSPSPRLRILELGSGTGLVGITAALTLSADVTVTDLPHVLPNLEFNARANSDVLARHGGSVEVAALCWGEVDQMEGLVGREYDLVLGSDVVYHDHLYDPLLRTLGFFLVKGRRTVFVMAHLRRWKKEAVFFKRARKMFDVEVIHRDGLLSIAIVTSGAGFLSVFSLNYVSLVVLRCLVGFGLGGGPAYSSWFLEFVPVPNRGTWMVIFSTFWTFGTVIEASLAWVNPSFLAASCCSSIKSLLLSLYFSFVPLFSLQQHYHAKIKLEVATCSIICTIFYGTSLLQSYTRVPRYLCTKGRITNAQKILEKIARENQKSLPSGVLVCDQSIGLDEEYAPSEDNSLLCPIGKKPNVLRAGFSALLVLFSSKLIRTTLSLWLLFFGNAFSYYGIVLLTSELSSGQKLPGVVLSAILVDRIGRKLSMVIMFALGCIFLLPLVFHQKEILTCLLFGVRMCIMGTITVANIYAPEIYPTSIRATGFGLVSAVGRIGGMICPLVAVGLVTGCHQTASILLFEAVMVVSGVSVMLLPLETNGRDLTDIVAVPE